VAENPRPLILRVTRRCLRDDLSIGSGDLDSPIDLLAQEYPVIAAFQEQRSQLPTGQETIQDLSSKITAFSLHAGEFRGLTWHQEKAGVVWLLAVKFHRSGKRDDAYPYFLELDAKGQLLPTREDVQALTTAEANTFARSLLTEVPLLLEEAESKPGTAVRGLIGGRVSVRLLKETGERPMLTVAISFRILPGETILPDSWVMTVAGAFFPQTPAENLATAFDLGGRPLGPDEFAFCDFTPLDP
jgi:hypothetical protein